MRRVVITGMGLVSPLGCGVEHSWQNVLSGQSGCGLITKFDTTNFSTKYACEIPFGEEVGQFRPSDWMDENKNINRIVISQDYKINGKKCSRKNRSDFEPVKDGHSMDQAICFQYYNPIILDYISSRIK